MLPHAELEDQPHAPVVLGCGAGAACASVRKSTSSSVDPLEGQTQTENRGEGTEGVAEVPIEVPVEKIDTSVRDALSRAGGSWLVRCSSDGLRVGREGERGRARMLQRLASSRAVGQWSRALDNSSFGSRSSSLAFATDEVMSASSMMAQDANEAASNRLGLLWLRRRKKTGGALTWRVIGEAGGRRSLVRDRRRIRGSQNEDGL